MNAVTFLRELVSIKSVSGEEEAAAAFLTAQMGQMGMAAQIDAAGNAVGIREQPDASGRVTREIVMLGHMDTVPGEIPVRLEDGRLYGRGAVDAKGPLAAFVMAGAQAPLPPGTRLVVIGAVEEESATSKGARYAAAQFRPDFCIIGEPSGWDGVTLGYKGRLLLDFELSRPMGHTAGPERGVAEAAVDWWNAVRAYAGQVNLGRDRLFDQLIPSLRHIESHSDGLTNRVRAKVGLRLPPDFDAAAFETMARQWAREQAEAAHLRCYGYEPAFQSGRRTPLAQAFNQAIRQTGARPRFKRKTGTSDMNVVGPQWQCPIVAYGPGDSKLDHTPQEHVLIDEYLKSIGILTAVLQKLSDSNGFCGFVF